MTLYRSKGCLDCGRPKSSADFYTHPTNADGLLGVCKDCHRRRMRSNRRTNPLVQERERLRKKRNYKGSWRQEHPMAYRAQTIVGNAVRDKKLIKEPCAMCGNDQVHAHHKDYSKPLEVVWLCAKCHQRIHAVFPELGGHAQ